MYPGYQINNILESLNPVQETTAIYNPQFGMFDIFLSECAVNLFSNDSSDKKSLKNTKINILNKNYFYIQPYSMFMSNHAIRYVNEQYAYGLHVNSIIFVHDYDSYSIKAEEKILACQRGFRKSDTLVAFNTSIENGLKCTNLDINHMKYSIPDELVCTNTDERTEIGIFSYNKTLSDDLVRALHKDAKLLEILPGTLEETTKEFNRYKIVVELDTNSIINVLAAIACGSIGIINDPNDFLSDYRDVPNLHIVKSVGEIQKLLSQDITKTTKDFPQQYRNFDKFKTTINEIMQNNRKKAFVL